MTLNNPKRYELEWGGRKLILETGRVAKQAGGAVLVTYGETVVLVASTAAGHMMPNQSFFPLTVDFREQTWAAGKFPGGFFKREGRPSEKDVLTCRIIDRPIRPLFPEHFMNETQVIARVISHDRQNDSDILGIIGASASLGVSDIPFAGPIAAARVGYIDGAYVLNPTVQQLETSRLDAVVVCSEDSVVMVEGGAKFLSEGEIVGALEFAQRETKPVIELQKRLVAECGKAKREVAVPDPIDASLVAAVEQQFRSKLRDAAMTTEKHARYTAFDAVKQEAIAALGTDAEGNDRSGFVKAIISDLKYRVVREMAREGRRLDGRDTKTVRPIEIEASFLPRTHGSVLFTRGETQAIVAATLGTSDDTQRTESLERDLEKRFYLHYSFPPYSVGETRRLMGPGRREIGHGNLAERAIIPALPEADKFAYTMRIYSEITESNGSSSMASVCGASLALMDAGVPIKDHVAGVAMGLIKEGDEFVILTDILGDEDHLGDMDFKVAGSAEGITSFQMDIKIDGVDRDVMARALDQAKAARLHIIDRMKEALTGPRAELSEHAPRMITVRIPQDKIGAVIGPGGKVIRAICADTGAKIDIEEDGLIKIFSVENAGAQAAKRQIEQLVKEVKPGEYYVGTVRKIVDFGAFVEILPGTDGLVHISEIAAERIQSARDVLNEGDRIVVVVVEVDPQGKIRLSRKRALDKSIEDVEAGNA